MQTRDNKKIFWEWRTNKRFHKKKNGGRRRVFKGCGIKLDRWKCKWYLVDTIRH